MPVHHFLDKELIEIHSRIPDMHKGNPQISLVDVGWHLYHTLKVILSVCNAIRKSDPHLYTHRFNLNRSIFFLLGRFPRGVAKSPRSVIPPGTILEEDIKTQHAIVRKTLDNLDAVANAQYCTHPIFGMLSRKQSKRFLLIHTRHHLKIVRDILRAER